MTQRLLTLPATAAVALVLTACLGGCGGDSSDGFDVAGSTSPGTPSATVSTSPVSTPPTSPPTAASTATSSSEPEYIQYAGGESPGVTVHNARQVGRLRGAPADFREFIGRTAQALADDGSCEAATGVTVSSLRTDGFAEGAVTACGGYRALWAVVDGRWQEVSGTQELWDCQVLEEYGFPDGVVGRRCYDYQAQEEKDYDHA